MSWIPDPVHNTVDWCPTLPVKQLAAARRFVAAQAIDADDCRLLLDVLGLS